MLCMSVCGDLYVVCGLDLAVNIVSIYHGHYQDNLLKSTIISIPKDAKASLSNVDNYRGISLSNSINKVFDYVIIELYQIL